MMTTTCFDLFEQCVLAVQAGELIESVSEQEHMKPDGRFQSVGQMTRIEVETLVAGYQFDLRTNEITAKRVPNPNTGAEHRFVAYRLVGQSSKPVILADATANLTGKSAADKE
ncbi:MAG: hypothetical protein R6W76_01155 [Caldilinea sp.]